MSEDLTLQPGRVYRTQDPQTVEADPALTGYPAVDDRMILRIQDGYVQYDAPSVPPGADFPCIPVEQFWKWAHTDVTEQTPDSRWNRPPQTQA